MKITVTRFKVRPVRYGFYAESWMYLDAEYVGRSCYYTDASEPRVCVALTEMSSIYRPSGVHFYDIERNLTREQARRTAHRMRAKMATAVKQAVAKRPKQ